MNTLKEEEIRPKVVFDEFLNLAKNDIKTYFATSPRTAIVCPACTSDGEQAFRKNEFDYALCPECQTLLVSPHPAAEAFNIYYIVLLLSTMRKPKPVERKFGKQSPKWFTMI